MVIWNTHNSSSLTLKQLSLAHLSFYSCRVTDSVHDQELEVGLVEVNRLYIMAAGGGVASRSFPNGTELTLACTTRGGAAEGVTWSFGDHPLEHMMLVGVGSQVEIVAEGNMSRLSVSDVTTGEAGVYACQVQDQGSGVESRREFDVTITVAGRIVSSSPQNVTATEGERVQFDCFTTGIPPPNVTWIKPVSG